MDKEKALYLYWETQEQVCWYTVTAYEQLLDELEESYGNLDLEIIIEPTREAIQVNRQVLENIKAMRQRIEAR